MRKNENKQNNKPKNDIIALGVSILALFISLAALLLDNFYAGELMVYSPTGFCIVRGYKDIGFPSDHLVIPFTIENTGKGLKTLQAPTLHIQEKSSGLELVYRMTGAIPDLYAGTLDESYQPGFGVSIPEHSVREYYLVFHVEDWWDKAKPDSYDFHFEGGQEWNVSLSYQVNGQEVKWENGPSAVFFPMPIYETVNRLKYGEAYNSDCFSTSKGAANTVKFLFRGVPAPIRVLHPPG